MPHSKALADGLRLNDSIILGAKALQSQLDDEDLRLRAGRRISLLELILWVSGISVGLATPYWFDLSSLLIFFYGTLCVLAWRLSKAMPITHAIVTAVAIAVIITAIMVPIIQR